MLKSWKQFAWIVAGLALLTVIFAPPGEAGSRRITLQMAEPYEIDGQLYPAGELSLRELSAYNPTTTLNELWVDNECLGLRVADTLPDRHKSDSDMLIFTRDPRSGNLILEGVAFRGESSRGFRPITSRSDSLDAGDGDPSYEARLIR